MNKSYMAQGFSKYARIMGYRFLTDFFFCSFPCQVMVEKMGFPGEHHDESSLGCGDVLGILLILFNFSSLFS